MISWNCLPNVGILTLVLSNGKTSADHLPSMRSHLDIPIVPMNIPLRKVKTQFQWLLVSKSSLGAKSDCVIVMKTIQIELSDQQFSALGDLSKERGKSISELVSVAVEQFLSTRADIDVDRVLANIRAARGIWSDRDDIGSTEEYVRNLRKGTAERMKRLGIWKEEQ